MAHSIQELNGRYLTLNDLDVIAFIRVGRSLDDDKRLSADGLLKKWERQLETAGPGTIDLDLDTICATPSGRASLDHMINRLLETAPAFGAIVPSHILDGTSAMGAVFGQYETYRLTDTLLNLKRFVAPSE